jgi:transcriptional regulator with GAF, ATPase, and Fis domain
MDRQKPGQDGRVSDAASGLGGAEETLRSALRLANMQQAPVSEIVQFALEEGERLTGSKIGYFHFVNPDQKTIQLYTWSSHTQSFCSVAEKETHYAIDKAGVWVDCIRQRKPIVHNDYESLPHKKGLPEGHVAIVRHLGVPVIEGDRILAVFGVGNKESEYTQFDIDQISLLAETVANMIRRREAEEELKASRDRLAEQVAEQTADLRQEVADRRRVEKELQVTLRELRELKERVEAENVYLRHEIGMSDLHGNIIGQSDIMKAVLVQAEQVAKTDSTVLILGETGTGKELLARAIHRMSERKDRPLVVVNCAAMPAGLVESELFGRERGAYTGAVSKQIGRFEVADKATIFLDEIGELPPEVQAKLLRVLQEGQFERLGSTKSIRVDVRVIVATNRDIEKEVEEGRFRQDLFYRLNVFPITVPPIRDRREDIPLLVSAFCHEFSERMGKNIKSISRRSIEALQKYSWPGNVRELRNVIERAMIQTQGRTLHVEAPSQQTGGKTRTLAEAERQHIISVLERTGWRVRGHGGAAETLGLKPTTLDARMKKLGIQRPTKGTVGSPA